MKSYIAGGVLNLGNAGHLVVIVVLGLAQRICGVGHTAVLVVSESPGIALGVGKCGKLGTAAGLIN